MADPPDTMRQPVPRSTGGMLLALLGLLLIVLPFVPAPSTRIGPIDAAIIKPNGGFAYTASARDLGLNAPFPSTGVELTEDGAPLRVDHMHSVIRSAGQGRYSPWGSTLYFSATDNSDPRINGRAYVLNLHGSILSRLFGGAEWSTYIALVSAALGVYLVCLGIARARPMLADRLTVGVMRFSPFDLRCILRLALLYSAWREASADYAAIPELLHGVTLHALAPTWLDRLASALGAALLDSPARLAILQIAAVVLLIVAAAHLRRWSVLLALAPTLIIEWTAYHYRGQLPDIDPMLAVLVIAALWPASWRAVTNRGRAICSTSTAMGLTLAAYLGAVYFVCGWSKVITDGPWWKVVHLDLLYAAMIVWMGSTPPHWLDPIARGLRDLFVRWPWLGQGSALLTMILELTWPLALVSRLVRWIVPTIMLAAHAIIFLTSGILFLPLALTGISIVIPWRRFVKRTSEERQSTSSPRAWMVWPMGLAALLALIPAMNSIDVFPFSNYQHFNWNHTSLMQPTDAYRLGYRDRNTGQVRPIPTDYGGFMDCWSVSLAAREVEDYLNATNDAQRTASHERLLQYARALRPHNSSRRLGWLSCPPHVLGESQPIPFEWFDEPHLLRGRFESPQTSLEVQWQDCGTLAGWPESDDSTTLAP